jgi:DNA invertase Pin-like site-specific DNA recombinase
MDEGVSAFRGANALDGGLSRFLDACRKGLIEPGSFLLVESLDRISRMAPRRAQRLIDDIVDNGVTIVTLSDNQQYTAERLDNDPTSLLIALMVSWRAHEESKTKGRRVAAAWEEKRRKFRAGEAERLTRQGPSWLIAEGSGWIEDAPKVAIVRRIFAMTLAGEGEHKIAKLMNEEGVPVLGKGRRAGKLWHRSTVSKVLRSPAVVGTLVPGYIEFKGGRKVRVFEQPVSNAFPAIISEADWLAVRSLKDGKSGAARGRHAGKAVTHVMAGLARCPECGSTMSRVNKGYGAKGGLPKLVCNLAKGKAGCRYVSVKVDAVEEAFLGNWGTLFADIPAGGTEGALDRAYSNLEASISGTEDLLSELVDALEATPSVAGSSRVAKVEAELRLMRTELEELDERRRMADQGLIRARIDELQGLVEASEQDEVELNRTAINTALKVLFKAVVVDYRTGHLRFQWRQGGESSVMYAWVN